MIDLTYIGRSRKTKGVLGAFKVVVDHHYLDDLKNARAVFIDLDGSRVPFILEEVTDGNVTLVRVEKIDSPESATPLLNKDLYLASSEVTTSDESDSQDEYHILVGYALWDQNEALVGTILEIQEFPSHIVAKVDRQGKEILIPMHSDLMIDLDEDNKKIVIEVAEGLLDL